MNPELLRALRAAMPGEDDRDIIAFGENLVQQYGSEGALDRANDLRQRTRSRQMVGSASERIGGAIDWGRDKIANLRALTARDEEGAPLVPGEPLHQRTIGRLGDVARGAGERARDFAQDLPASPAALPAHLAGKIVRGPAEAGLEMARGAFETGPDPFAYLDEPGVAEDPAFQHDIANRERIARNREIQEGLRPTSRLLGGAAVGLATHAGGEGAASWLEDRGMGSAAVAARMNVDPENYGVSLGLGDYASQLTGVAVPYLGTRAAISGGMKNLAVPALNAARGTSVGRAAAPLSSFAHSTRPLTMGAREAAYELPLAAYQAKQQETPGMAAAYGLAPPAIGGAVGAAIGRNLTRQTARELGPGTVGMMAREAIKATKEHGGATIAAKVGDVVSNPGYKGTAVATQQIKAPITDLNQRGAHRELAKFIEENRALLLENPDRFSLGVWEDGGKLWVEIAETMPRERAIRAGQRMNQQAVADLDEIYHNRRLNARILERTQELIDEAPVVRPLKKDVKQGGFTDGQIDYRFETPQGEVQVLLDPKYASVDDASVAELAWFGKPLDDVTPGSSKIEIGDDAVREILYAVAKDNPDVETLLFTRVSGMRAKGAMDQGMGVGDEIIERAMAPLRKRAQQSDVRTARAAEEGAEAELGVLRTEPFIDTGGTGDFLNIGQLALRNLDLAGPGTTGGGRVAAGAVAGGVAGALSDDDPETFVVRTLMGAVGGGLLGQITRAPTFKAAYKGGLIQSERLGGVPNPLVRGNDGRLVVNDAFSEVAKAEVERIVNDPRSFGTLLHHRFGQPLAQGEGAVGQALGRGSSKLGKDEFRKRMLDQFPHLTDKRIEDLRGKSFNAYRQYVRGAVDEMEDMADWDTLLGYYYRGGGLMDGQQPWYTGVRETVFNALGEQDGEMFIRFLAALSPQTSAVGTNITMAKQAFLAWKFGEDFVAPVSRLKSKDGKLVIKKGKVTFAGESWVHGVNPRPGFGDAVVKQAVDATGEGFKEGAGYRHVFKGRKLDNYYRALMGDEDAVVVDMWMARMFGFKEDRAPNEAAYSFVEQAVRQMAREQGVTPMQVQAQLWAGVKQTWTDLGRSPREIIENYGRTLQREAVNASPGLRDIAFGEWSTPQAIATARALGRAIPEENPAAAVAAMMKLGNQMGFVDADILRVIAKAGTGAVIGGAVGAKMDEENPLRGAAVGAAIGAAGVAGGRAAYRAAYSAGRTQMAKSQQEYAEAVAKLQKGKRTHHGGVDAPTSGYHVNDPVDLEEFLGDVAKMNLGQDTEAVLQAEAARIVRERGLPDQATRRVTETEMRREAKSIGLDMANLNPRRMTGAEVLAVKEHIADATRNTEKVQRLLANPHLTLEEMQRLARVEAQLDQRMGDLLENFNVARSEFGRNLNSLRYHAGRTRDPLFWYGKAKQNLRGKPWTSEVQVEIDRLLAYGEPEELVHFVNSLRRPGSVEKTVTLWKAGLLSNITTHEANLVGNLSMAALEASKDTPTLLADRLLGLATGQTTKGTAFGLPRSLHRSIPRGVKGAAKAFRTGITPASLTKQGAYGKYDLRFGEVNFDNPILNLYTKTVYRSLLAGDAFFRSVALERGLVDYAEAYARQAGLKGEARRARVKELLLNPPDDMVTRALGDAEVSVFMNTPRFDKFASGPRSALNAVIPGAGDMVLPFTRTPLNIIERAFEYSPLGFLARAISPDRNSPSDVARVYKLATDLRAGNKISKPEADLAWEAQRRIAETLGRSTTGTALALWAGYSLAAQDKLTGAFPSDANERARWQLEGRQENSVLIAGSWHRLDYIAPIGNIMVFGAHMYQAAREAHPEDEPSLLDSLRPLAVAGGAMGGTQSLLQQSFLKGLNEYMSAALTADGSTGSTTVKRLANSVAGSLVPGIIGRYAQGVDTHETPAGTVESPIRKVETPAQAIQARTFPGGIEALGIEPLPVTQDRLGRARSRDMGSVETMLNPFRRSRDKRQTDEVVGLLAEWNVPITTRRQAEYEDDATFRRRLRAEGLAIEMGVRQFNSSRAFQELPDEVKREAVLDYIGQIRRESTTASKNDFIRKYRGR